MDDFLIFAMIGFAAQLVDGSLGMGYGAISSATLLATGIPPAHVSASVHAAKLFTTATSAASHVAHGNVKRELFMKLAVMGAIGGVLGVLLVTAVPAAYVRMLVTAYLLVLGIVIVLRAWVGTHPERNPLDRVSSRTTGAIGGFIDGVGGGGWGPVVTSTLIGAGKTPRYTVGTVNTAEFFVTVAVLAAFLVAGVTGFWTEAKSVTEHFVAVAGLVFGGTPAAMIAGYLPKKIDARALSGIIGLLVLALGVQQAMAMV
jgi:uncharacterized membrane protein YfcA